MAGCSPWVDSLWVTACMVETVSSTLSCVIVLGMHRSGTSLVTGSLEDAGLNLGEVNHAAPFNRKGNKENEAIRDLNDSLLARSGAAWNAPPNRQVQWSRADEEWARLLIEPYLYAARPWGFKDPRTIWTVEGWLRLLPDACLIGVFRHPSLVVRSLAARTGDLAIETDEALRLWCAYNSELIRLHQKYRFPILHYRSEEALREEFITPLTAFARSFGLTGPLDRFFESELLNHVEPDPIATTEARNIFDQLIQLSQEKI